jgi:hypothetical protein
VGIPDSAEMPAPVNATTPPPRSTPATSSSEAVRSLRSASR